MRKFINSVKNKATKAYIAGKTALAAKKGEGYIDTASGLRFFLVIYAQ